MAEAKDHGSVRRHAMKVAAGALCCEAGFSHAEDSALETLTEMLQSYVTEIGRSTRAFSELSCRTEPMLSDVVMSLVEMGVAVEQLPAYARRANKMFIIPPAPAQPATNPKILHIGEKKEHPSHIADTFPVFPDPHTYIRTLTHKPPISEYQLLREKAASQKRDVERALTRFIAKTGETESLFQDDPYAFPLIACKPKPLPYLDALIPKDQDLDAQEETEEPKKELKSPKREREMEKEVENNAVESSQNTSGVSVGHLNKSGQETALPPGVAVPGEAQEGDNSIDNPYLRPITMPKLKGKSKSKLSFF